MKPTTLLPVLALLAACGQDAPTAPEAAAPAAVALIADPCGGPRGEAERSDAWLNAELVQRGHALALVCRDPDQPLPGALSDKAGLDEIEQQMAAMDTVAALLKDKSELTAVMIQRQSEAIAAG